MPAALWLLWCEPPCLPFFRADDGAPSTAGHSLVNLLASIFVTAWSGVIVCSLSAIMYEVSPNSSTRDSSAHAQCR